MTDFVECFGKVHYESIGLVSFMHGICQIVNKPQQLCFRRSFVPESTLEVIQDAILVSMSHDGACNYMFLTGTYNCKMKYIITVDEY